jgi:hypothetical protein
MRRILTILFLFAALKAGAGDLSLANGDRIVFMGHSDMQPPTGRWSDYARAYLALHNPSLTLHMQEIARSGTAITSCFSNTDITLQRYPQFAYPLQPKYVFFQYAGAGGFTHAEYQSNVQFMVDNYVVGLSSAIPVLIGLTPEGDASGGSDALAFETGELNVAQSYTPNKLICTNWSALVGPCTNPANWDALNYAPGDVHPSPALNIAQAWETIRELGWDTNVSSCTINATDLSFTTNNCVLSSVTGGPSGISFTRHDDRLPWAIDEVGRHDATNIWPQMIGWQNYRLKITGLAAGNYSIVIKGTNVATVSSATLAAGWNMADLTSGPVWEKGQEVLGRIRDMQDNNRTTLIDKNTPAGVRKYTSNCITAYQTNGKRGATLIADSGVQTALAELDTFDGLIKAAAQPDDLAFTVTRFNQLNVGTLNVQ